MAAEPQWSGRQRGGRLGTAFFLLLLRWRLDRVAHFCLFFVSLYFVFFSPKGRRASFELAERLGLRRRLLFCWRHNYRFGTLLMDRFAILSGHADRYTYNRHGHEELIELLKQGKGVVLLTAHVGSWEILGQLLVDYDVRIHAVMHEAFQPELQARLNVGRGFSVLQTDGSPAAAAQILEALQRGEIVGMMGDRLFADEGVAVDFLGAKARLPVGPYALAAATGAPLVYTFAIRKGYREYDLHAIPAGTVRYTDRRNKQADHQRWARDFAARLEEFVRRHPTQWCNFFSVWHTG